MNWREYWQSIREDKIGLWGCAVAIALLVVAYIAHRFNL